MGVVVRVAEGEFFENAIRRFKKTVERNNVLGDIRRKQHYVPPSERRRQKSSAARHRSAV